MIKQLSLSLLIVFGLFVFTSCEEQDIRPNKDRFLDGATATSSVEVLNTTTSVESAVCGSTSADFIAGQNMLAGTITVENTETTVTVTYTTTGGWTMGHTHLYVGDLAGVPVNKKGNPKIGNFPNQTSHDDVTTFTYTFDAASLPESFIVAAHAEVNGPGGGQTAWGAGTNFTSGGKGKSSWATYFDVTKGTCDDDDDDDDDDDCTGPFCGGS